MKLALLLGSLILVLQTCTAFKLFFSAKKQVKDAGVLELDLAQITKGKLESQREILVACAILLRLHYTSSIMLFNNAFSYAMSENITNLEINERFYLSNLEHCIGRMTSSDVKQVMHNQGIPKKLGKLRKGYFLAKEGTIKSFLKSGMTLSANQIVIREYMQSELDSEFVLTIPIFEKLMARMDSMRLQVLQKTETSIWVYLAPLGVFMGFLACFGMGGDKGVFKVSIDRAGNNKSQFKFKAR